MDAKERKVKKPEHECIQGERIDKVEGAVVNLRSKVDALDDKVDALDDKIDERANATDAQINKLTGALLPDELHPDNGVINAVRILKKDMSEVKQIIAVSKAYIFGGAFVITIVWTLIQFGINMIEKKNEPTISKKELIELLRQIENE